MPSTQDDQLVARLSDLLSAPVTALGLDLEAVEVVNAGKHRVLRLSVDQDGGVGLDEVADVTREVSRLLDESDAMGERPYTLEVGSRGVDRPLTLPRHWRRNVDRLVKVTLADGTVMTGRIGRTDEERALLDISGKERQVLFSEVRKARIQVEFKRPSKADDESDETAADADAAIDEE